MTQIQLDQINLWFLLFLCLLVLTFSTFVPILFAYFQKVKLNKTPIWFKDAEEFKDQKNRLMRHELRFEGTLIYWKNQAVLYSRINNAKIIWSLISATTLPVLIQFYDKTNFWSVTFLTTFTLLTGFIVSLAYSLRSEELYRGYRECESDYYDAARYLLDHPQENEKMNKEIVDRFLILVYKIRKAGRKVETGQPPSGIIKEYTL